MPQARRRSYFGLRDGEQGVWDVSFLPRAGVPGRDLEQS